MDADTHELIAAIALGLQARSNDTVSQLLTEGDRYRDLFFELRDRVWGYASECDSRAVASELQHIIDTLGRISPVNY